jgi:hypothetical protein
LDGAIHKFGNVVFRAFFASGQSYCMLVDDHTCVLVELSRDVKPTGLTEDPVRDVELRILEQLRISVGENAACGRGKHSRNEKHQDQKSMEFELMQMIMKMGYSLQCTILFMSLRPDVISLEQLVLLLLGDAKEIEQVLHALRVQPSRSS